MPSRIKLKKKHGGGGGEISHSRKGVLPVVEVCSSPHRTLSFPFSGTMEVSKPAQDTAWHTADLSPTPIHLQSIWPEKWDSSSSSLLYSSSPCLAELQFRQGDLLSYPQRWWNQMVPITSPLVIWLKGGHNIGGVTPPPQIPSVQV